jgi:hypothetical protein
VLFRSTVPRGVVVVTQESAVLGALGVLGVMWWVRG